MQEFLDDLLGSKESPFADLFDSDGTAVLPDVYELIEQGTLDASKEGKLRMPGFHASFISGSSCLRAYYFHYVEGESKTFPTKTYRTFDVGKSIHILVQRYLRNHLLGSWKCQNCHGEINANALYVQHLWKHGEDASNILSYSSEPAPRPLACPRCDETEHIRYDEWRVMNATLGLSSEMDGILLHEGTRFGIEIKSAKQEMFSRFEAGTVGRILQKYKLQFGIYMHNEGLDYGVIIVWNKNDERLLFLPVSMDEIRGEIEKKFSLMERAKKYADDGIEPPACKTHSECPDCPFKKFCFE